MWPQHHSTMLLLPSITCMDLLCYATWCYGHIQTISWSRRLQQESTLEVFPPYFGFESFWVYMVHSCNEQKLLCSLCVYKWMLSHFFPISKSFCCSHAFLLKSLNGSEHDLLYFFMIMHELTISVDASCISSVLLNHA